MKFLSDQQLAELLPAETASFASPVPTQIVSSDEYLPVPQTSKQRRVEARLKELGDRLARHQGVSRRRFFQTASGMAASFVALNEVFGPLFDASPAEAATPELADERAAALKGQFIIDGHTHFLRDDTRLSGNYALDVPSGSRIETRRQAGEKLNIMLLGRGSWHRWVCGLYLVYETG